MWKSKILQFFQKILFYRERYEDELPFDDKYFQENEIELFTSNYQRTKLSLAYVLAGG